MTQTTEATETAETQDTAETAATAPAAAGTAPAATTTAAGGLCYQAIPGDELDAVRAAGRDEAGNPLKVQVHHEGGTPLRCCLREGRAGERLLLIAYTPPGTAGAYAERGPVFIHAERCEGYPTPGEYPPELAGRQQVVRAYDKQGRITDGVLVADGRQAQAAIAELLARPEIELVHLRNVGYGCYNFAVRANG
jgi:hypothetical protein